MTRGEFMALLDKQDISAQLDARIMLEFDRRANEYESSLEGLREMVMAANRSEQKARDENAMFRRVLSYILTITPPGECVNCGDDVLHIKDTVKKALAGQGVGSG
jgi:hypothetical protein